MKLTEILNRDKLSLSFEVFPPKTDSSFESVKHATEEIAALSDEELYAFLTRLKKAGLDGIEGYYTEYTPEMQKKYQEMAKKLDLQISGGTDFHAAMKPHIAIGRGTGELKIPYEVLEKMKNYYKNKKEGTSK